MLRWCYKPIGPAIDILSAWYSSLTTYVVLGGKILVPTLYTYNKIALLSNPTIHKLPTIERPFSLHVIVCNLVTTAPIAPATSFPLSLPFVHYCIFMVTLLGSACCNKNGLYWPSPLQQPLSDAYRSILNKGPQAEEHVGIDYIISR